MDYSVVLVLIVGILTCFILKRKSKWNYVFCTVRRYNLKWIASYLYLKYWCRKTSYSSRYNLEKLSTHELAVLPFNFEIDLEKPGVLIEHKEAFDSVAFCGTDENSNCLYAKVIRYHDRHYGIHFMLRLNEIGDFTFTHYPDTNFYNTDGKSFSANGLCVEVLEPMRKWRISYNGMLQKLSSNGTNNAVHVKLVFIWTAISLPFDFRTEFSESLYADYLVQRGLIEMLQSSSYDERFRQNRYEQWGEFAGTVSFEDHDEMNIYLRGLRSHSYGLWDWNEVDELIDVQTYFKDGTAVHVGYVKHKRSHLFKFGWMITPNGSMYPIDQLEIKDVTNGEKEFVFRADWNKLSMKTKLSGSTKEFLNGERLQNKMTLKLVNCNIKDNEGFGIVRVFEHHAEDHYDIAKSVPQLLPSKFCTSPYKLVTNINDSHCYCIGAVGGKACSLALLNSLDSTFSVPRAVCLTTYAYSRHLAEHHQIQNCINELQDVLWKKMGNAKELCNKIESTFLETSLNTETSSMLEEELYSIFEDDAKYLMFALRSSAVDEDGEEMSLAGQNETYLGINGFDKICSTIIKCWASQFSYHAIEYKRQNGRLINPGMGVVIQEMVAATSSGVIFTNNPVTENTSEIVINASYGLGEGIVSGTVEPDTMIIERHAKNDMLKIKSKNLGKKQLKLVMDECGGTKEIQQNEEETTTFCLMDEMMLKLAELSVFIEKSYGAARDIEWAIDKDHIFILQARPITSAHFTKFELIHELDSPLKTDFEICTKANTGEVFPGASSPLTISTITRSMDVGIQISMAESHGTSFLANPLAPLSFVIFSNHVMLNCLDVMYRNLEGKETSISNILELAVFGYVLHNKDIYEKAYERHGDKMHSKLKLTYYFMKGIWNSLSMVKNLAEIADKLNFNLHSRKSTTKEILGEISSLFPFISKATHYHGSITASSMFWNLIAIHVLVGKKTEWNEDVYSDIACLLASCKDVVSADVPNALKELAELIATNDVREKFANEFSIQEAVEWLSNQSGILGEKYQEFLVKHGHRCLREFDLFSPSWRMNPADFVSVLQNMVKNYKSIHGQRAAFSTKETIQQLKTSQSFISKNILLWILPRYRAAVGNREKSKSSLIKCIDYLRAAYCKLGNQLVEEGMLPESYLIFFMTHYEITQLVSERSPKLIKKAMARRKIYSGLDKLKFPELNIGRPQPIQDEMLPTIRLPTGTKIIGTPVCNGVITGTARVVKHLSEACQIQANDILITYCTDIGWSPYFPLLSGIVTEIGGILSHGAVVAREFGVPCIVGAHDATLHFKSGDIVSLNGNTGVLELLKE